MSFSAGAIDTVLRSDASLITGGSLAAARMTANSAAIQSNTLAGNFTTTSGTPVDTGLTITPASARTRALLTASLECSSSSATGTFILNFTNATAAANSTSGVSATGKIMVPLVGVATTMGTACKIQGQINGGFTLTLYSEGCLYASMET